MTKEETIKVLRSIEDRAVDFPYMTACDWVAIAAAKRHLQEEPVSDRLAFKAIPRLLEMIEPTDRAKSYTAKLADALEVEGYPTDAKIVRESLKIMNGEKVAMSTMDEEPVSEELEKVSDKYSEDIESNYSNDMFDRGDIMGAFEAGSKWQKEHLWKDAQGNDLPEYEREVVVFTQNFPDDAGMMRVAIGHRPNPDGWEGKSLSTGKVEHYTPKTYDKGGWNIPDVKYWLDVELPKEIEL